MTMKVSEAALLKSGFTPAQLQAIKNNVENYSGTLGEAIQDLANRFRVTLWVFYGCVVIFIWVIIANDLTYIVSTGIGLLITMAIVIFTQPPVLAYKSWRYWRAHRTNSDPAQ
nr:hypothetical protein [Atlantibacter sp.]